MSEYKDVLSLDLTERRSNTLDGPLQFFRVASTTAPALPVNVEVGDASGARLAAACVAEAPGSDVDGGHGCAFEFDPDLTPTIEAVVGAPHGRAGTPIVLKGSGLGNIASMVSVGIGGTKCTVAWVNETSVECALDEAKATAGTFPVVVSVEGKGLARYAVGGWAVNYTINLEIDSVLPINGSRCGGDEITISGSGFARLGPMQQVRIDGVPCVPKTLKNVACRFSELDSGVPCASTVSDDKGYPMVTSPYVSDYPSKQDALVAYYTEWLDFSTPTRIVCVLEDLVSSTEPTPFVNETLISGVRDPREFATDDGGTIVTRTVDLTCKPDGRAGVVNVTLPVAEQIVDDPTRTLEQRLPAKIEHHLDMATRNLFCHTLLGYKIWNVAYYGGDCVLWNKNYNDDGTFGDHLVFNGSSTTFGGDEAVDGVLPPGKTFDFLDAATPKISAVTPATGSPGSKITITGSGFEPTRPMWDKNFYMDEFGFYTQPEPVVVYVGDNPTVITHRNDTHIETIVIYNKAEIAWDVQVWVHGKGRAQGDSTFTYGLYMFDISPPGGSVMGGTPITITGQGFATTHTFYSTEDMNDMGSSLATYDIVFGGDKYTEGMNGVACKVTKVAGDTLECTTKDPATAVNTIALDNSNVETYIGMYWNYEPFYWQCARPPSECTPPGCRIDQEKNYTRSCHFAFEYASTPLLTYIDASVDQYEEGVLVAENTVHPGDTLSFTLLDACTNVTNATDGNNGTTTTSCISGLSSLSQNFNWTSWAKSTGTVLNEATAADATAVDGATLKLELPGNISCAPMMLDVSAGTLNCTIDENAVPQGAGATQTARLWLDHVGYAVTDPSGPWFELRPMVSSIAVQRSDETAWRTGKAAQSGSLGGGLTLLIRGRGFVKDYLNYIRVAEVTVYDAIYYGYCTDIDVINSTALTCVTPAFRYTSTTVVTVVVNGTESTCETYGTGQCDFTMSDNSTDDTPIVSSFSPTTGVYDPEQQQLIQIIGDGFVPGNTTVTIGSAECTIVTENATNLDCALPRHVAGVFELKVHVVAKGLAVGDRQLSFMFGIEVRPSADRSG